MLHEDVICQASTDSTLSQEIHDLICDISLRLRIGCKRQAKCFVIFTYYGSNYSVEYALRMWDLDWPQSQNDSKADSPTKNHLF